MRGWNMRYGRNWMIQWQVDGWISFGIHVDFRTRSIPSSGEKYGPYVDLHLGCVIVSVGRNARYTSDFDALVSTSRGGIVA